MSLFSLWGNQKQKGLYNYACAVFNKMLVSLASVGDKIYHIMFLSKVELVVKKIPE